MASSLRRGQMVDVDKILTSPCCESPDMQVFVIKYIEPTSEGFARNINLVLVVLQPIMEIIITFLPTDCHQMEKMRPMCHSAVATAVASQELLFCFLVFYPIVGYRGRHGVVVPHKFAPDSAGDIAFDIVELISRNWPPLKWTRGFVRERTYNANSVRPRRSTSDWEPRQSD